MENSKNKVYIVLLNYNSWKDTIECLESVLKSDYPNFQIIVVDNNSSDNSMNHIIKWANGTQEVIYNNSQLSQLSQPFIDKPINYIFCNDVDIINDEKKLQYEKIGNPIIFIQSHENNGFSAGNNIAIKYALEKSDSSFIWLLNNDTAIKRDSLSILIKYAKNNNIGITGSTLKYYYTPNKIQAYGGFINVLTGKGYHIVNSNKISKKLNYIIGASFLIDINVINKIGLLPEEYFLYYEDSDYCYNALKYGYKIDICIKSIVYHKEGASTGTNSNVGKKSSFSDYQSFYSRKLFYRRNFKSLYFLIYFQAGAYILHRLLIGHYNNAKAIYNALKK